MALLRELSVCDLSVHGANSAPMRASPAHTYFAHGAVRVPQIRFVGAGLLLQIPYFVKEFHKIPIQLLFGFWPPCGA